MAGCGDRSVTGAGHLLCTIQLRIGMLLLFHRLLQDAVPYMVLELDWRLISKGEPFVLQLECPLHEPCDPTLAQL